MTLTPYLLLLIMFTFSPMESRQYRSWLDIDHHITTKITTSTTYKNNINTKRCYSLSTYTPLVPAFDSDDRYCHASLHSPSARSLTSYLIA